MRLVISLSLLFLAASARGNSPADAVSSAHADLQKVPERDRPFVRYHSLYHVPAKDRETFLKVHSFQVNSLSRKARLRRSQDALAAPDLVRLDVRDFGWDPKTYDKLSEADPYFHVLVQVEEEETVEKVWPGGVWPGDGKFYPKGAFKIQERLKAVKGKPRAATAPWLPADKVKDLVEQTGSSSPVLRADWFLVQTGIQRTRVAGYYDFLGLKKRDDFWALIGFNLKDAQDRQREIASIVRSSGVSEYPRQVYRFGANDFGYWQTRDVFDKTVKERNAVNALNGDFKHDAEEHYGFLPNGLFGYYLSDANGEQQDYAPPEVGFDSTATNNGARIHIFKSCVTCHKEGLRPLKDYGRTLFRGPTQLVSFDKKKFERLEQLYLLPLLRWYDRDANDFAKTLADLNGPDWTPLKNAQEYSRFWKRWAEDEVTLEQAALEIGDGQSAANLKKLLVKYATPADKGGLGQVVPNAILAYMQDTPDTLLRPHLEEAYYYLQSASRGLISK